MVSICSLALLGCQADVEVGSSVQQSKTKEGLAAYLDSSRHAFPQFFSIQKVKDLIKDGELKDASRYVNLALNNCATNACLHLVNGFIYEEMARMGDSSYIELAGVAYQTAYNIDPSQWYIVYLYGQHLLRVNKFSDAQRVLADAAILRPKDPKILYSLAYASYYLKDLPVAAASIEKAAAIAKDDPVIQRAAAVILASAGKDDKAKRHFDTYKASAKGLHSDVEYVSNRISDWKRAHDNAVVQQAASGGGEGDYGDSDNSIDQAIEEGKKQADEDVQSADASRKGHKVNAEPHIPIIIECYILSVDESKSTSKGTNIMDAIANGMSLSLTPFDFKKSFTFNREGRNWIVSDSSLSRSLDGSLSANDIKYNVNIANAGGRTIEVLGRPSVSTMLGKPAAFMAGEQVVGGVSGNFSSGMSQVDVGLKVEVTPIDITPTNKVVMNVTISGTILLVQPDPGRSLDSQCFKVGKSKTMTTVKAAFGQTVMVGGLYQRTQQTANSEVPLLGDLPLLQYIFANEATQYSTSTVLYLLTPRRGGDIEKCTQTLNSYKMNLNEDVSRRLESQGLSSVGDYVGLRYILKALMKNPLFFDFRTGDLLPPFYGQTCSDMNGKIDQLLAFTYF
ncbi:hypothetical protein HYD_7050 [Candidatus Hydrogenosomobacter endosymbioticus]|uniref:Type II/III secretion system secretin-like domain-containing protein n=1 Tax=Candidatus Hydrogenosomobacter endosymbioticus TaxID=2558174 RepID=A0ABM7VAI4_9PROT|nr:hypothetical protein HYD_7050 [Candidatus Hydrogenosomobacter endosymbioticus]